MLNLTSLSASDFKSIVKLMEEKEALQARLAKIDEALAAFEGGKGKGAGGTRRARVGGGRKSQRGAMKASVIELLKGAGKDGITVKEIATKLGVEPSRIYTWFYTTGKAVKEIKKVGEAKYAWVG